MVEKQDEELNILLNNYKAENAKAELLDRIVVQAQSFNHKNNRRNWVRNLILLAAIAIISFGIGFLSAPSTNSFSTLETTQTKSINTEFSVSNTESSSSISLDTFLLGPNSLEEIML